ncbi:hypothetical protein DSO57_1008671 [Entomophthora muscae]|uniref:Uncharacterized protein n=1 Tax=Entomophthora muscae TaxID=34485 RepID=A0ACC2T6T7_9FUNG|nr:hypothetical protein DSO57_1008671 [Entomophthora muscae]
MKFFKVALISFVSAIATRNPTCEASSEGVLDLVTLDLKDCMETNGESVCKGGNGQDVYFATKPYILIEYNDGFKIPDDEIRGLLFPSHRKSPYGGVAFKLASGSSRLFVEAIIQFNSTQKKGSRPAIALISSVWYLTDESTLKLLSLFGTNDKVLMKISYPVSNYEYDNWEEFKECLEPAKNQKFSTFLITEKEDFRAFKKLNFGLDIVIKENLPDSKAQSSAMWRYVKNTQ